VLPLGHLPALAMLAGFDLQSRGPGWHFPRWAATKEPACGSKRMSV
jgi:hypothetical protein